MLLETALADFSTDESQVFEDEQPGLGFQWDRRLSKSNSALKGAGVPNSDKVASPAEIKRIYLDGKLPSSSQSSGDLSTTPNQSRQLSDFLGMSRSPPAVDVNCGPNVEICGAEEDWLPPIGKGAHPRRTQSFNRGSKNNTTVPDGKRLQKIVSFTEDAGRFAWEELPGKPRLQRRSSASATTQQARQIQMPPVSRVISMSKNEKGVSPSSVSSQKEYRKEPLQQGRVSSSPKRRGVSPIRQSTRVARPSGDSKQIKRPNSFKAPPIVHSRLQNHRNRSDAELIDNSISSDYKYFEEESPVSILQRPTSPPTNSSGSSGSSAHSPPLAKSATISAPPLPGVSLARRRLSSLSSSSAQDSPRASTSSSTVYMSQCLAALQAALAIDPEKSRRFEHSFLELDTYVEGDGTRHFAKSPIDDDGLLYRNELRDSPGWARERTRDGATTTGGSELDPEYHTMDFYTDSEEEQDNQPYRTRGLSASSSLARSSSGNSISGPIRRSLNYPPVSVDQYSLKDKRLLSSHPSSWVDHGDDSVSSSLTNSKCNTMTRHQEVPWDEQQEDLDAGKVEEVVRGAVDGLRFTYSPVSSAFVFTRQSHDGEEAASGGRGHVSYHSPNHKTFTDSEASRRFSVDYETSLCSEDSMSFARGSDVTELGMSRAESWSKVARGIAYQQGYQDAVPSSFMKRAGNGPTFEAANDGSSSADQSPRFNPGGTVNEHIATDSRLVRKRPVKKSGMTTCLPFRSILRNFRTIGSPGRSRLGMAPNNADKQKHWTMSGPVPTVSRITY